MTKYRIIKDGKGWFHAQRKRLFWWTDLGGCCVYYATAERLIAEDQRRQAGPEVVYENWK